MTFGENFKKCRLEMFLTQKEVAKILGVYKSKIIDWENDISRPEYEKLIQLAEIYNVSISELLGVDENCACKKSEKKA